MRDRTLLLVTVLVMGAMGVGALIFAVRTGSALSYGMAVAGAVLTIMALRRYLSRSP